MAALVLVIDVGASCFLVMVLSPSVVLYVSGRLPFTFVMWLSPLLKPVLVRVTSGFRVSPATGVVALMVMPPLSTLVLPIVIEPALVRSMLLLNAKL